MSPSSTGDYLGVILAAGKGTRIKPFSEHLPKPLLPVLDRPLLLWQIETMRELGIRDIVIVIGHLGHHVVQVLGDGADHGVNLSYIEQQDVLGIAHAVGQLESCVDRPFLLFLGDIFFETSDLAEMFELHSREGVDAVLACKEEDDTDAIRKNFTVMVDDAGFIKRLIEKPRHPQTRLKGCGLYMFDPSIFDAIRRTPRTALRDEYELTDSIQIFIEYGYGVVPACVVERDLNLSGPEDLLDLNLHVMRSAGFETYVAEDAVVEDGAQLDSCVVMSGARVPSGARLKSCVVLPGERIRGGKFERTIFTAGVEVLCDPR